MRSKSQAPAGFAFFAFLASAAIGFAAAQRPLGLDAYMPVPDDNPLTDAKVRLGRLLFFDRRLSRDGSLSCSTCHDPARAFSDERPVSVGVFGRRGTRNVPVLVNRGYGASFFWDGRVATLERQVVAPIENTNELDMTVEEVVIRLKGDHEYVDAFRGAFSRDVRADDLARALASYVRSILDGDSAVDRYFAGDRNALAPEAQAGLRLFRGKANCTACHVGPLFTDERFHNTGVAWRTGEGGRAGAVGTFQDEGRAMVTGRPEDRGAFKTPTLREVARTAPYMHDGSFGRLEDVIDFYDQGARPNPLLDSELRPLHLTSAEKASLLTFLRSLSGTIAEGR